MTVTAKRDKNKLKDRRRNSNFDWPQLEHLFITSDMSLLAFAAQHKVNHNSIYQHAHKDQWVEKRDAFTKKKAAAAEGAIIADTFRTSEAVRLDYHKLSDTVRQKISSEFIDPTTGELTNRFLPSRAINDHVNSLEKLYKLEMISGGHQTGEITRIDKRVLAVGVTVEQVQGLGDADLDLVLQTVKKTKLLPGGPAVPKAGEE